MESKLGKTHFLTQSVSAQEQKINRAHMNFQKGVFVKQFNVQLCCLSWMKTHAIDFSRATIDPIVHQAIILPARVPALYYWIDCNL